jgi:organic hydroperoxide reductase OsmC/OhrA
MKKQHHYQLSLTWTGNTGQGTRNYSSYSRTHILSISGKPLLYGSADPAFRGDRDQYNPEELFLASIASCHMLWYLHLCSEAGVIVLDYKDDPIAIMDENEDGSGRFASVSLQPHVLVAAESMSERAYTLHNKAHLFCFIANSCNFPIYHNPSVGTKI